MIKKLTNRFRKLIGVFETQSKLDRLLIESRIAAGFSRGSATSALRTIDPSDPLSWEFGAFSQHGEDGILDYLIRNLKSSDKYFLEIAAGDGLENCTAHLALGTKWSGVMVEGDRSLADHCRRVYQNRIWNVLVRECYVNLENIGGLLSALPTKDFDLFSLDIDSIDFHILKAALQLGYRPKIIVAEYNSAFGPEHAVTVPYKPVFNRWIENPSGIYYGASVMAWRVLLEPFGYKFVSVDSSGTNAFFANKLYFKQEFIESIIPNFFLNNASDINPTTLVAGGEEQSFALPAWEKQSQLLQQHPLEFVTP